MRRAQSQQGQAMTEFVIVATAVLVPLLVGISLLGKWSHATQLADQTARYLTWEKTVWFSSGSLPTGDGLNTLAVREDRDHANFALERIYATADREQRLSSSFSSGGIGNERLDPLLKLNQDNSLLAIEQPSDLVRNDCNNDRGCDVGLATVTVDALNSVVGPVMAGLSFLRLGDEDFGQVKHNSRGLSQFQIEAAANVDGLSYQQCILIGADYDPAGGRCVLNDGALGNDLKATSAGAIVSDSWNVASAEHFRDKGDNFALGGAVNDTVLTPLRELLTVSIGGGVSLPSLSVGAFSFEADVSFDLMLLPDLESLLDNEPPAPARGSLGYVGVEPVPGEIPNCPGGTCVYEE